MIYFLVRSRHRYVMDEYLRTWGRSMARRLHVLPYEELASMAAVPRGTYVFSDLDRLDPVQTGSVTAVWERLAAAGGVRLLNHPTATLGRFALLRLLAARGQNRHDVYRVAAGERPRTYPVFVRDAREHTGSLTGLLDSAAALERAVEALVDDGHGRDDLLVVEYRHGADGCGVFRKYSAIAVGERIVPRHVWFSRDWMQKASDLLAPALLAEEERYLRTNPHQTALRAVFALARVQYGRIDYAVIDGAIEVWEINLNPMLFGFDSLPREGTRRMAAHAAAAAAFRDALAAIDSPDGPGAAPLVPLPRLRGFAPRSPWRSRWKRLVRVRRRDLPGWWTYLRFHLRARGGRAPRPASPAERPAATRGCRADARD